MTKFKYAFDDNKRYHTWNYYLRNTFGEKVFKVSLNAGFTCPNLDGKVSKGGCTYCSNSGSGDFAASRQLSITDQIEEGKQLLSGKQQVFDVPCYIAYFQAFTNTYAPVEELRKKYEEALAQKNVIALSIGTRPDCLDDDVLDYLEEVNKKTYLWVELGLQTINDKTAHNFNRGYDFESSLKKLQERGIEVVVHTIFGLPGETKDDMLKTVDYVAHSGAQGVKFHLLHLMKGTKMVEQYESGELQLLSREDYIDLICKSVAMIPEDMVVHRLTGDAPRQSLIGPMWSLKKWEVLNDIDKALVDNNIWQGKDFK